MAFHARSLAALGSTRGLRDDAFSNISKFFAMTPIGIEDRWWKLLSKPVVGSKCTGSFDCVRLAPHFAQDDSAVDYGSRRLAAADCGSLPLGAGECGSLRLTAGDWDRCGN